MRNSLNEDVEEFGKVGAETSYVQSQTHSDTHKYHVLRQSGGPTQIPSSTEISFGPKEERLE